MAIGSSLTHTWVNSSPTINFPNNIPPVPAPPPPTQVQFQGESTSLAIGGGFLWMSGFLEDPTTLLQNGGNVEFQLVTTPIYTRISFWRNGAPLGKLTGLGLNVQVGLTINGIGKFS